MAHFSNWLAFFFGRKGQHDKSDDYQEGSALHQTSRLIPPEFHGLWRGFDPDDPEDIWECWLTIAPTKVHCFQAAGENAHGLIADVSILHPPCTLRVTICYRAGEGSDVATEIWSISESGNSLRISGSDGEQADIWYRASSTSNGSGG